MMSPPDHSKYSALLDVTEAIASHSDLATLIGHLARRLPQVVPTDFLALSLYDSERRVMRLHTMHANVPADIQGGSEFPLSETPAGLMWDTQQAVILPNLAEESRWPQLLTLMRADGVQSCCVVPLTTATQRLGALAFCSVRKETYAESDAVFLQHVGRQVAVAVENVLNREAAARSKGEVEQQRDRLKLLLRMTNAMVSKLELREVFHAVSRAVREIIPQEYASLILYDEPQHQFRLRAFDFPGNTGWLLEGYVSAAGDSLGAMAIRTKRPVVANRLDELRRIQHEVARMLVEQGFKSMCSLPLLSCDRAIGCLNLASRQEEAFGEPDMDFLMEVAGQISLAVENALTYEELAQLKNQLAEEKDYLEEEIRTEHGFEEIIGDSTALKQVLKQVEVVAPTDSTVLIQGETGTGKELIARAIHRLSGRHARTFVKINCAAIPTGLLESELFGHERGAFTGAIAQKVGRFELATHGTIFLDEVGEIPLDLQSKLLRVLQEEEFERLGSTRTIRVDVRLIAATNRDLKRLVESQQFRSDLYYRLHVFPITLPPLRERREDIPTLVRYFTQQYASRMNKTIEGVPGKTLDALTRYPWPGNIRELENVVERSVILTQGPYLQVPLGEILGDDQAPLPSPTLEETERAHILRTLRETKWVIGGPGGAAVRLGLKRTTLASRMKKLGIVRSH